MGEGSAALFAPSVVTPTPNLASRLQSEPVNGCSTQPERQNAGVTDLRTSLDRRRSIALVRAYLRDTAGYLDSAEDPQIGNGVK